jgi:UDP-3-O-[3-hydroxymyristoyl] glucosamine N-acyltransferase
MIIHPTAIVSKGAVLGNGVEIGPYSIIHENVVLGDNVRVEAYCELGYPTSLGDGTPLVIGNDALIRSHSIFYESSVFGDNLVTGHHVTVREKTFVGKNFQIGTLSDIQGDCVVGDYVRLHSNVHIGKMSKLGSYIWLFPYVVLTNDPHPPSSLMKGVVISDFAVIATMTTIMPGVFIGEGALIGAHSSLRVDAEPGMLYVGSPAIKVCPASKIRLQDGSRRPAYPWTNHFRRGYPDDVVSTWSHLDE